MQFVTCYKGFKKGQKPDELTWSAEEYLEKQSKFPYLCEFLSNDLSTFVKPFADFDLKLGTKPSVEDIALLTDFVTASFNECLVEAGASGHETIIATRECALVASGKWKVSIRLFATGCKVRMQDLKQIFAKPFVYSQGFISIDGPLFDPQVYNRGRKMNCVTKCKDPNDLRILRPVKAEVPLADYLIQFIEDSWPALTCEGLLVCETAVAAPNQSAVVKFESAKTIPKPVKINKIFGIPLETNWESTTNENGTIKMVPDCMQCIVTPNKIHSQTRHCALFHNPNNSMSKTCFSCGSAQLTKAEVKKVKNAMSVVVSLKEDTTEFEELVDDMIMEVDTLKLRREENTGIILKPIYEGCNFAYEHWLQPKKFLNKIFKHTPLYKKNSSFIDKLEKYLKEIDDDRFPFVEYSNEYIAFKNGVLHLPSNKFKAAPFDQDDNQPIAKHYINSEFQVLCTDTPLFDSVLDYQFDPEVRDFIYMCLGRLLLPRDDWGFMLYLLGEPNCGKSLVLDVVSHCVKSTAAIGDTFEQKFGLGYLYDKDLVVCDDLPKHIDKLFPQQTFQSCITNGQVPIAVKNKDGFTITWKAPMIWAGNYYPSYIDKGQVSRRLLIANFENQITNPNPQLKKLILQNELPAFINKCNSYYQKALDANNDKAVWNFCPEYFLDQRDDLRAERNPFFKFLTECCIYNQGSTTDLNKLKTEFASWLGTKVKALDKGTLFQVNPAFTISKTNICKSCHQPHKKGCCSNYNRSNKTTRMMVNNIMLAAPEFE